VNIFSVEVDAKYFATVHLL